MMTTRIDGGSSPTTPRVATATLLPAPQAGVGTATAKHPAPGPQAPAAGDRLPDWRSVLAVVAHPDDESFGLGALLDGFASAGAEVSVLCLTPGETYALAPVSGDLVPLRRSQLKEAARTLGATHVELRDYAGCHLAAVPTSVLVEDITGVIDTLRPDGLLVFDEGGVVDSPDHAVATRAAVEAAAGRNLSVLGWGLPEDVAEVLNDELGQQRFTAMREGGFAVPVDRERQRLASLAYSNESAPTSLLWRRLELLGETEHLRWLRRAPADRTTMRVTYDTGDRFAIDIRDHRVVVDQPPDIGGDDLGPTPTELFVASLASCVAFYARRYLRRHRLDPAGLTVETAYRMATRPARVAAVTMRIVVPSGVPEERRAGLLAAAGHCTVHNSITTAPDIALDLV